MHGEFLLLNEGKMAKSDGSLVTLADLSTKGFNPLAYRYLTLSAHYRSKLNFTWESLQAAQNALHNLYSELSSMEAPTQVEPKFCAAFEAAINDDLDMPQAIAIMWDLVKNDEIPSSVKLATLLKFDEIFGLNFLSIWESSKTIPEAVKQLLAERETARANKDFQRSDELREEIEQAGFILEDSVDGLKIKKKF
jgi:cysteinyl-tRNA synthetase